MELAYFTVVFNQKKKNQWRIKGKDYPPMFVFSPKLSHFNNHVRTHTCISTYKYTYSSNTTFVHYCHKQGQPITPFRPRLFQVLELNQMKTHGALMSIASSPSLFRQMLDGADQLFDCTTYPHPPIKKWITSSKFLPFQIPYQIWTNPLLLVFINSSYSTSYQFIY